MIVLPIADARAQFSKLVEEASTTHERIEITKNGHRAAVLLGEDDYDSLIETIAVLSDPALLELHQRGVDQLHRGDSLGVAELTDLMNGQRRDGRS